MATKPTITFINDGKFSCCGMVDSLRGIVSLYNFCKSRDIRFRIHYTYPFQLTQYLKPYVYDWLCSDANIYEDHSPLTIKIFCDGRDNERSYHRSLLNTVITEHPNHNIHIYTNTTCYDMDFGTDFRELFEPTEYLSDLIQSNLTSVPFPYNSVSCRFCGVLDDFPDMLLPFKKDKQKEICTIFKQKVKELAQLSNKESKKLLVTSDSKTFISSIIDLDNVCTIPGPIVHSRNSHDVDGIDKTFVEFLLISMANKVYSITSDGLFPGAYSYYASRLGGNEYVTIKV